MTDINLMTAAVAANPEDSTAKLALADAITEAVGVGVASFYPEMGESQPVAHMEARLSHYGKHYFIDTPLTLKGRGIEFLGILTAGQLVRGAASPKCGWNQYKVTIRAFEKLREQYRVSMESLL